MAKKTKDEIIKAVNALFGEDATDEQLSLLEDISDSFESSTDNEELEKTRNELEKVQTDLKEFRQKYRDRFLGGEGNEPSPLDKQNEKEEENQGKEETLKYDDLFTSK